ncbi:MAG: methionyl-tRNA formyltransferase [Bryobacterales bacterium]|nr:methionyl-tRNA formyltransferase [Bryobacterales bacterium]
MDLVYLGTPQFAVPTLEAILASGHCVLAVVTQPERAKGREHNFSCGPVKECAMRHGLAVYQPERIRHPEAQEHLRALKPDVMVVVGYGQIIPQTVINMSPMGIINVHASLLPKYRGAAPIQWAIARGELMTGVTTMRIDAGLDTGDILLQSETVIEPGETAPELSERLAAMGADLLVRTLETAPAARPQNSSEATLAPILKKEDGRIDWTRQAQEIHNQVRGLLPWPGAHTTFRGRGMQVWKARVREVPESRAPGTIWRGGAVLAACGGSSSLELLEVQLEGKKRMPAELFANGQRFAENEILGGLRA